MYQDKNLICKDCQKEFVYTVGEQEFYAEKGFQNEPSRCKECRQAKKDTRRPMGAKKEMFDTVCSDCGKPTQVPFQPSLERPVYCRECYDARK